MRSEFLKRLLGEPMLHFALISAALFLVYGSRNDVDGIQDPVAVIEITPRLTERLAGQFREVWQRDPTPQEREGLIKDFIREEVLYREAVALGLDRDDAIVRQRMRLKMELLSDGMAGSLAPDEAALAAWFAPREHEFSAPPAISFLQVLLDPAADAATVLAGLNDGADPGAPGHGSLLPRQLEAAVPQVVDSNFGVGFHAAIAAAPEGRWSGPFKSAYGMHLVKVLARSAAGKASLDAVRPQVLEAWRREQGQVLREKQFDALLARYRIVRPEGAAE